MSAPAPLVKMTPEEYLSWEAEQETKHEYSWGEVTAMAGGTPEHGRISFSLAGSVFAALPPGCGGYSSDSRVAASEGQYFYPDLTLICGEVQTDEKGCLLNPLVVFEVLSPSTESRDRGEKFLAYQGIKSLSAIVFVSQDKPLIEAYTRQSGGVWLYEKKMGLGEELAVALPGWSLVLPLAAVFSGIEFPHWKPPEEKS